MHRHRSFRAGSLEHLRAAIRGLLVAVTVALGACGSGGADGDGSPGSGGGDPGGDASPTLGALDGADVVFVAETDSGSVLETIALDGSRRARLFTPPSTDGIDVRLDGPTVSPDGTRIAFTGNFDAERSLNVDNVYVISRGETPLRRPSDAPSTPALAAYPTGRVEVAVERLVGDGALSVWVQGSAAPLEVSLREGESRTLAFDDVADFGDGVAQRVRVVDGAPGSSPRCVFGASVDVIAGAVVDAGRVSMLERSTCPSAFSPAWADDERLLLLLAEPALVRSPNAVWTVDVDIAPGLPGERLLAGDGAGTSERLTGVAVGGQETTTPQALLRQSGALSSGVFVGPLDALETAEGGPLSVCDDSIVCTLTGMDATPDGRVAVLAVADDDGARVLRSVDDGPFETVLSLPGEAVATVAVSADGASILFDRAVALSGDARRVARGDSLLCPCRVEVVDAAGGAPRLVVENARSPDWL